MPDELGARLPGRVVVLAALAQEGGEGATRPRRPKVAGDRGLEFAGRGRGPPQPERLRLAADSGEGVRLGALERGDLARQRKGDEGDAIGDEGNHDAADQGVRGERHQRGRTEPADRQRPVREEGGDRRLGPERRQKQQVEPAQRPRRHAGDRASRRAAPPEEAAEKRRGDLRDRGEGQEADRDEGRLAGHPLVKETERQDADDRETPHDQDQRAEVSRSRRRLVDAPPQEEGHDEVVGDGDRQREAVEHHHPGRGRQAADHGEERHAVRPAASGSANTVRSRLIAPSGNILRPATARGATNRLISTR